MKKLIIVVLVAGGFSALTSCKKDHTCSCSGKILGIEYSGADTTLTDMTKSDAEAACNEFNFSLGADNYQDCELK